MNEAERADAVRSHLCVIAGQHTPMTYHALAKAVGIDPPHSIHKLSIALERLMEEDAMAGRPLISSLVISKARGGLPAPGFFDCARRIGCLDRAASAIEAAEFYAGEVERATEYWARRTGQPTSIE